MYYADYCRIADLGCMLAAISRNHWKVVSVTQYYRNGEVRFAVVSTDSPEKE